MSTIIEDLIKEDERMESGRGGVRPPFPKKRIALMIGYVGTGYQGMQLNPNAKTIESTLWNAIVDTNKLISKDNSQDPKKVGWMRSCRTDKGVHAAGQVVSCKILWNDKATRESIRESINEQLPKEIKIFGVKVVTGGFHAKERTDSRYYEYLMPTYCLNAIDPTPYKTKIVPNSFIEEKEIESIEENGKADMKTKIKDECDNDKESDSDKDLENEFDNNENNGNDGSFSSLRLPFKRPMPTSEQENFMKSYRITPDLLEKFRLFLQSLVGHHSFHNFTIGKSATDPSAFRNILSITVSSPFLNNDKEWISIVIHGQSFMLNQIRKMVGLAIMAIRLEIFNHQPLINKSFSHRKINIPRAPALGLLLDRAIFTGYNRKFGDGNIIINPSSISEKERDSIDWMKHEQERQLFKTNCIYPEVFRMEDEEWSFWGWLNCTDSYASEFNYYF